jgi:hypothetical protein
MYRLFSFLFLSVVLLTGCRDDNNSGQSQNKPAQGKSNQSSPEKDPSPMDETVVERSTLEMTDQNPKFNDDGNYDHEQYEFVYDLFDEQTVLDYLNLSELYKNRTVNALLNSQLRRGDTIIADILETGDGTFDIYKLVSDDEDIAFFYPEKEVISAIEIVSSGGTPDTMIHPGLTYEQLRTTYENPVAYGSEIEGRVFVFMDSVYFRMATTYAIPEPVDIEDDTEILLIQF